MRVGSLLLLLGLCGVSGCGQSSFLDLRVPVTPTPTPTGTPTATPTAIPTPTPDFGDGHDGALTVVGTIAVNQCRAVSTASGSSVDVGDTVPFPVGRRILLHQVQSDFATVADGNDVTTALMGGAGLWEIGRVESVAGTTLTLGTTLSASYTSAGTERAQACTIPEYTDLTLPAGTQIDGAAWDGAVGGIVAFYVNGIAQLDGRVVADSKGFRGGARSVDGGGSNQENNTTSSMEGGGRGEALDGRSLGAYGRGYRANGAGGGNAHNAGGGGGGGSGGGGLGGFQGEGNAQNANTRGRGGRAVLISGAERLVFGGGGGGGHQDNGGGGAGGRGGGAILVFANDLRGVAVFDADGGNGVDTSDVDGAGGGGGGGMVVIEIGQSSTFAGELSAEGGFGGTAEGDANYGGGPGGGGGGGWIVAPAVVTSGSILELGGGPPGYLQAETNNAFGSTGGANGVVVEP